MARPLRALIIGGSLGGLATACLLRRDGWNVDIFERVAQPLSGRGAGIVTHPQLLAVLAQCGANVDAGIGVQVNMRIALDAAGHEVGRLAMPQLLTSWGSLYAILKRQLPEEFYHSDASLTRVENLAGGVRAHFANGEQSEGDLL